MQYNIFLLSYFLELFFFDQPSFQSFSWMPEA